MKSLIILPFLLSIGLCDVHLLVPEEHTPPPPPKPYAFGYAAGRFPGHIDRTHSEVSDGSGLVQGSYSYVDPKFRIRKVDYVADKDGFHVTSNDDVPALPSDTPVVAAAKINHLRKYAAIADAQQASPVQVFVPADTVAVQYAKNKHLSLYEKIAADHARIAAELEAAKHEGGHGNEVGDGFYGQV
ncbi:uncharacterized protein [Diabrotica undecimpunctata]|uniref:uncharacterized protein n=1 Tax=Diabrotica undecimpunctata TaxID=50387 RepID=UPI003B635FA6